MTTPKRINRAVVALKLPRKVPDLIKLAQSVVTAMTGTPERRSFVEREMGLLGVSRAGP